MPDIYLDNAATTPPSASVLEAMREQLADGWGNPSSVHRRGVRAREALDRARGQVARAVGAESSQVVFTSGGTEANNLALFGVASASQEHRGHVLMGPAEHASVRAAAEALAARGFEVETGRLTSDGTLDLEDFAERLRAETSLVIQMLVSNEFGVIFPVPSLARLVRARAPRAHLHVDAVQALGKLDLCWSELGADSLSISGHKIHGPMGVGALVFAKDHAPAPLLVGGGQERGLRSGTEGVPAIVGLGVAAKEAARDQPETLQHLAELRARLHAGLADIEGIRAIEAKTPKSQQPGIYSLLVPGAPAEVWLHHLDARGVAVGTGSACQANKNEISPVLLAMGLTAREARQVLRLSMSCRTSMAEIERTLTVFQNVSAELAHLQS